MNAIKMFFLGLSLFLIVFVLASIAGLFIGAVIQTFIGFESKVFAGNFSIGFGIFSGFYALYRLIK